jgi:PAS domain S-box-containing protein
MKIKPQKLPLLLVLIFLLFAAVIGAAGYYFYLNQKRSLKQEMFNQLTAIADLKVRMIDNWRKDRAGDAALLVETPFIAEHARQVFENPKDTPAKKEIQEWLTSLQSHYQYKSVFLLDARATVRLSVPEDAEAPRSVAKDLAFQAIQEKKVRLSELYRSAAGQIRLSLLVPILTQEGPRTVSIGTLLLRIDPYQFLYPLVESWPTPSRTAESALVCREGDEVVYLNEAGHGRMTPLASRLPLSRKELPETMAVLGREGIVESTDDRGVPVLAAMRHIPESPWFLVAKVDRREVYTPIREHALATAVVVGLMILGAGLAVGLIWHRRHLQFEKTLASERERNQEKLIAQSRILEAFFTSSVTPLVFLDKDFNFIRVNEAYARACQRDASEFPGHNHFDFYPSDAKEIFEQVVKTKTPSQVFARPFVFPDHPEWGETYWDWTLTPILDNQGNVEHLAFSLNDVTESKKAEKERRAASLYARSLLEASLDPLVTISPDGKITDVNRATELVTGCPRERLTGSDFSDYFTEPEKAREGYQRVFSEGFVKDYPLAIRHISGRITDVLYNAVVYKNEAGLVQGVFAAARDMTEIKLMEQEHLRLVAAVEQAGESIVITDSRAVIDYVNPAFERANGGARYEILKTSYVDILSSGIGQASLREDLLETVRQGGTWSGHVTRKRKDGKALELDVTLSPVKDKAGRIMNYLALERDVTRELILQEHIRRTQKMEALGTLAGGIAHDLNNILSPIMINTEIALWDTPADSPTAQALQTVLQASVRGKELVKQILAFTAQTEREPKPLSLRSIIRESLNLLMATIPRTIEIRQDLEKGAGKVLVDPTQIHQVLVNLCTNSAYAMREKGGVLEVRLARMKIDAEIADRHLHLKPGPYVRLTVSDTGQGMSPEVMERIFDPFFTTKKVGEGTGMGLAVVHGIVKSCGGAITVYSEMGEGSAFNVYLPEIAGEGETESAKAELLPTGNERILLVDDEKIQIQSIRPALERLGYSVTAKEDGREALKAFRARPDAFDLVITDQTMPHISGLGLAEEVARIRPDIPVILFTGFSEAVNGKKAKEVGVRDFIMKPFSARDLAEAIRRALRPVASLRSKL